MDSTTMTAAYTAAGSMSAEDAAAAVNSLSVNADAYTDGATGAMQDQYQCMSN
jgi:hypothetical protein